MKWILLVSIVFFSLAGISYSADRSAEPQANEIGSFQTDTCTLFRDGTRDEPELWRGCCVIHDMTYWMGGTRLERAEADRLLKRCIAERSSDVLSLLAYMGVRVGGKPKLPTPWRWGYGWKRKRAYRELSLTEKHAAIEQLKRFRSNNNFIYHPQDDELVREFITSLERDDPSSE